MIFCCGTIGRDKYVVVTKQINVVQSVDASVENGWIRIVLLSSKILNIGKSFVLRSDTVTKVKLN